MTVLFKVSNFIFTCIYLGKRECLNNNSRCTCGCSTICDRQVSLSTHEPLDSHVNTMTSYIIDTYDDVMSVFKSYIVKQTMCVMKTRKQHFCCGDSITHPPLYCLTRRDIKSSRSLKHARGCLSFKSVFCVPVHGPGCRSWLCMVLPPPHTPPPPRAGAHLAARPAL